MFMYVNVGSYGADSDAGIFRHCKLLNALEQDKAGLPPCEQLPGVTAEEIRCVFDDV